MIQLNAIQKGYAGETLLENISFSLNKGERCGLVGRNGSGKSTLLRLITSDETPDAGTILFPKNYRLGFLKQHIEFSEMTVLEEAALALPPHDKEALYKVEKILFGLGLKEEDMQRPPSELSGGYQLRLHLTKVLVAEPDCLLLDEPTNYLDIVSIRWLERYLRNWKGEMILISHDRGFMDSVTTHTLGVHRRKIKKVMGGTENYYTQIVQEEEVYERTREKLETKKAHLESFITRFGAKASKATQAQSKQKAVQRMPVLEKLAHMEDLDFHFQSLPFAGKLMAKLEDVSFSFLPENPLIQHLSLEIGNQERIAIIGKNGRGKSTLLNLIAQELKPQSGIVKRPDNVSIGFFGQTNIDRLHPKHTIEEEIGNANRRLNQTEIRSICGTVLFGGDRAKKIIQVLSGGERSRVLIGKILATPCNLLLLDEPTHHLDMESIEAMVEALEQFPGTAIIVTHSELLLREIPFTQLVVCRSSSQTVFRGDYDEFLEKIGWEDEERGIVSKKGQKEDRQKNAEKVQQRSKALKGFQDKIERLEKEIILLETEVERENRLLIEASERGQSISIAELSRAIATKQRQIEEFMGQLDVVHREYVQAKEKLTG